MDNAYTLNIHSILPEIWSLITPHLGDMDLCNLAATDRKPTWKDEVIYEFKKRTIPRKNRLSAYVLLNLKMVPFFKKNDSSFIFKINSFAKREHQKPVFNVFSKLCAYEEKAKEFTTKSLDTLTWTREKALFYAQVHFEASPEVTACCSEILQEYEIQHHSGCIHHQLCIDTGLPVLSLGNQAFFSAISRKLMQTKEGLARIDRTPSVTELFWSNLAHITIALKYSRNKPVAQERLTKDLKKHIISLQKVRILEITCMDHVNLAARSYFVALLSNLRRLPHLKILKLEFSAVTNELIQDIATHLHFPCVTAKLSLSKVAILCSNISREQIEMLTTSLTNQANKNLSIELSIL